MKTLMLFLAFLFSLSLEASVQIVIVSQQGENGKEARLSAGLIENKLTSIYPYAEIFKPKSVSEIVFNNKFDTLIFYGIFHSNPFPEGIQRFGKLMMFLKTFDGNQSVEDDDLKKGVLTSKELQNKLIGFKGRKLVFIDACYAQLAFNPISKTTWVFAVQSNLVNLITPTGFLFSNKVKICKGKSTEKMVVEFNKQVYSQTILYKNDIQPEYKFVKSENRGSVIKPYKAQHHGEIYIF